MHRIRLASFLVNVSYLVRASFLAGLAVVPVVSLTPALLAQSPKPAESAQAETLRGPQAETLPGVIKQALNSVVFIETHDAADKLLASGSGFIASPDGRIVTNFHVIKGAHSALVKLTNGSFFKAEGLVASDEAGDIAILKVGGSNLPALAISDSDKTVVGQTVVAIGSPLGLKSLENTVSNGIISGVREISGHKYLQTTAAASPGNSGGPLINTSGEVVGIITWKMLTGESLNFAIPGNSVKAVLAFAGSAVKPLDEAGSRPKFSAGQSVYGVSNDFAVGRGIEKQFAKDGQFKVASSVSSADFVFVLVLAMPPAGYSTRSTQLSSVPGDELAMVLLPEDYSRYRRDLDALRDHALWQGSGRTGGFSPLSQRLVKKFEQEALTPSDPKEGHK